MKIKDKRLPHYFTDIELGRLTRFYTTRGPDEAAVFELALCGLSEREIQAYRPEDLNDAGVLFVSGFGGMDTRRALALSETTLRALRACPGPYDVAVLDPEFIDCLRTTFVMNLVWRGVGHTELAVLQGAAEPMHTRDKYVNLDRRRLGRLYGCEI